MPTVTILLNEAYKAKDGQYPIIIRVEHKGKRRKIPVGFKVKRTYWKDGRIIGKHPEAALINSVIATKEAEIKRYFADCQMKGRRPDLALIGSGKTSHSFTDYLRHRQKQYETAGKIVMGRKVSRFAKELVEMSGGEVYFEDIKLDFLRRLEQYQIGNGNQENTRHKKFKFLQEYYSQAMLEDKAPSPNPFKSYKIALKPVRKEKLSEAEIRAIEGLNLARGPVDDARNLFLFAYYCKGARFENCIMLRREDIRDGRIYFRTNKGNKYLSVKIHARLQLILDRYSGGEFVFPYVKTEPAGPKEKLKAIDSCNVIVNRNLKVVRGLAEIAIKVTFHIARHSFAYHLKKVSNNIHVIQDSLGHSDQRITEGYLKALEDDRLDGEMEKLYGL